MVRNGLMIALLALCPIRLKNFAALEIGRTLTEAGGSWWIVLPRTVTKSRRPDERRVSDLLRPAIGSYLAQHRPVLAGYSQHPGNALWLSSNDGTPMSYSGVEHAISQTTRMATGIRVSPHLFRTAAASTAAIHAGDMPHLASAILSHTDPRVTEQHYNRATTMSAAQEYAAIISAYRSK